MECSSGEPLFPLSPPHTRPAFCNPILGYMTLSVVSYLEVRTKKGGEAATVHFLFRVAQLMRVHTKYLSCNVWRDREVVRR